MRSGLLSMRIWLAESTSQSLPINTSILTTTHNYFLKFDKLKRIYMSTHVYTTMTIVQDSPIDYRWPVSRALRARSAN